MENPYAKTKTRLIKGELPKQAEIADWSDDKIVSLLHFVDHFTHSGAFKVTLDLRKAAEIQSTDNPYWAEFLQRIDVPERLGGAANVKFSRRFMTMARIVLGYLKKNPFAITEEMSKIMVANPRCHWALNAFKEEMSKIPGVSTVQMNNREDMNPSLANQLPGATNVKTPQVQMQEVIMNMVSILHTLTKGISREDMKRMSAKEKIQLANSMVTTMTKVMAASRPGATIFKQINVNASSKEDLEKAIIDYSSEQDL